MVIALLLQSTIAASHQVYPGVDVLLTAQSRILVGMRVGLITHRAGAGAGGWPTSALLSLDPRIKVVALFAPEHGLSGDLPAGTLVPSRIASVPVYSLYSALRKPSPTMLAGLDALVFDLQDVGTRAYTYISTMALAMQAAAEMDKLFVVLDRPNPLGGERMDGPVLDPAFASFIGIYPLPAIHGMTIGELALLFNDAFGIHARLVVIPMAGWQPSMQWEDTGLLWFRPSPTISSPAAAQLHASTGMLEGTNLTVGAGSANPYEVVTTRWLQGDLLADRLNERQLPGVRFEPYTHLASGLRYSGIRLILTDVRLFKPATTAIHILDAVRQLHPEALQFTPPRSGGRYLFDLVWGTDSVRKALLQGQSADRIVANWSDGLQRFVDVRQRFLIYARSPGVP